MFDVHLPSYSYHGLRILFKNLKAERRINAATRYVLAIQSKLNIGLTEFLFQSRSSATAIRESAHSSQVVCESRPALQGYQRHPKVARIYGSRPRSLQDNHSWDP